MAGGWGAPIAAPFNVGLMLLLTDGTVLAQNTGTSLWWRLWPDRLGGLDQAEWRPAASSPTAPLYFASAVLRDGSVFVAGGEYSNNASQPSDLCDVLNYDPVKDAWASLPVPDGWTAIGDAPCCVLPDGRLLLGNINSGACALWDPVGRTWAPTPAKANGTSNEETWTLLPSGAVLTVDCARPDLAAGVAPTPQAERFTGTTWVVDAQPAGQLVEVASSEIGPAILLPDGRVFALGATGAAGIYTPNADPQQNGAWIAAPNIPLDAATQGPLGAKDAPACLLPNGRVLCGVGPVTGAGGDYLGPTTFFEFDPVAGHWSAPIPAPPEDQAPPYSHYLLLLPTGRVLVSNGSGAVQVFVPDGAPDPAWAPTIAVCPDTIQAGAACRLTGTQLNGLSQACAYGDDAAMATNYPIVRLRAAGASNSVYYCRTANLSTMAVATGSALCATDFTAPAATPAGIYFLSVIANGIASVERPVSVTAGRPAAPGPRRVAPPAPDGEPPLYMEEELFGRALSEVHLLIDFLSGRADKSLAGLANVAVMDAEGQPVTAITPQQVVEEICKISYPPEGALAAKAEQAAFMEVVKDRLNYLAAPARGLTVAFTSMFAGVARSESPAGSWRLPSILWNSFQERVGLNRDKSGAAAFSAIQAYPNLERQARRFRAFYEFLPWMALALVAFIAYFNWDLSVSNSVLQQTSSAEAEYAKLFTADKAFLPTVAACEATEKAIAAAQAPANADARLAAQRAACDEAENLRAKRADSLRNLSALLTPFATYTVLGRFDVPLYLHPVGFAVSLIGPVPPPQTPDLATKGRRTRISDPAPRADLALAVVSGLSGIVIPTLFGLLGTLAGLLRSITAKVRDSVLAPRDYTVAWVSMFLGMAAGLTVGLFFNGADPGGSIARGLGGTVTISAAGLAFLGGFGAETFFTFLDGVMARLMPATPPLPVPPAQSPPPPPTSGGTPPR